MVINQWKWSATIHRSTVVVKRCSVSSKGPKVCQEIILHTITPSATFDSKQDSPDPTIRMAQQKSRLCRPGSVFLIFCCPMLVSWYKLQPQFSVLRWQEWHSVWSSAAFRDGLLLTLVVISDYLGHCCVVIS